MGVAGRVLAVDLGGRRIGLAVTDETRLAVRPLATVPCVGPRKDAAAIRALVEGLGVTQLVVGLPLLPSGEEGASARRAREAGADLARRLGLPLAFVDERGTTVEAQEILLEGGSSRRRRRARVDETAAAVILAAYLREQPQPRGEAT